MNFSLLVCALCYSLCKLTASERILCCSISVSCFFDSISGYPERISSVSTRVSFFFDSFLCSSARLLCCLERDEWGILFHTI